jgi:hypothetical protein
MDDDSLSTSDTFDIFVKPGRPVVGIGGDTLFAPTTAGGGNIDIAVNSYDSNGTISSYYWDFVDADGLDTNNIELWKTSGSVYHDYPIPTPDQPFRMAVFAKDDDGLMAGDTFWLYPDGPPPVPALASPGADTVYSTNAPVVFKWTGLDNHDSLATEYAVLVDPPGTGTPEDTVQNFKPASRYIMEDTTIAHTYTPGALGVYSWRIVAKDMRGSTVISVTRQFNHPGP